MGEAGVLGIVDNVVDGADGWRRKQNQNSVVDGATAITMGDGVVGVGILQLLKPNQDTLVPILGKKSSWDKNVNKKEECSSLGYDWVTITGW